MITRLLLALVMVLGIGSALTEAGPVPAKGKAVSLNPLAFMDEKSPAALAGSLRALLVEALSATLYEAAPGWGKKAPVLIGLRWAGKGLHAGLEGKRTYKNHGTWRSIRVTALNLPQTLVLDLRDLKQPQPGRTTFTLFLSFDGRVEYHQQKWVSGVRLSADSVRARFRVKLTLDCECITRVEAKNWLLPDVIFQLRVLRSDLGYDNVVCEHLSGFGGTAARLMGQFILGSLRQWHPSLERNLLARANAAIIKAGNTREVRISLGKLLKK